MKQQNKAWFVGQRAEQLAILFFTRNPDIIVTTNFAGLDHSFDLTITIPKNGKMTGRIFGVEIKARQSLKTKKVGENIYEISDRILMHFDFNDFTFPLCMAVFDMSQDEGYYRWLVAPAFSSTGEPTLNRNPETKQYKKLTTEELNNMITEVGEWYERRYNLSPTPA